MLDRHSISYQILWHNWLVFAPGDNVFAKVRFRFPVRTEWRQTLTFPRLLTSDVAVVAFLMAPNAYVLSLSSRRILSFSVSFVRFEPLMKSRREDVWNNLEKKRGHETMVSCWFYNRLQSIQFTS